MTLELHYAPPFGTLDAPRSETLYQLAEQLRYVQAIWEMLEAGTWSSEAGAQLDALLGAAAVAAGQLGCAQLRQAVADVRRDLRACVQRRATPAPAAAAALDASLARAVAIGDELRRCSGSRLAASLPASARRGSCRRCVVGVPDRHSEVPR